MSGRYDREYITRHEQIRYKLMDMMRTSERGCFEVAKIATELGMDQRTVRAHLRIIEVDNAGVFMDPAEKQFCTKEGIMLLASRLESSDIGNGRKDEEKGEDTTSKK